MKHAKQEKEKEINDTETEKSEEIKNEELEEATEINNVKQEEAVREINNHTTKLAEEGERMEKENSPSKIRKSLNKTVITHPQDKVR